MKYFNVLMVVVMGGWWGDTMILGSRKHWGECNQ